MCGINQLQFYRTSSAQIPDVLQRLITLFLLSSAVAIEIQDFCLFKMNKRSLKSKDGTLPLLQGELYIHIYEARDLPDMDDSKSLAS